MKICQSCDQLLAESMRICPSCGDEVMEGRKMIDEYKILEVIQEGYASFLCKAEKDNENKPVLIRLFKDQSGVNEQTAERLQTRLKQLNQLPGDGFVKHHELRKSSEGLWYRVSEWVDGEDWSTIFSSGILKNYRTAFKFFHQLASNLAILHASGHFMPHLVLSDIIVVRRKDHHLQGKIDYKLARFLNDNPHLPGTMLNDLLQCHPDIVNKKPLDFRSDIWSLGKVFYELLTTTLGGCPLIGQIDSLKIPRNAKTLLKTMLAQDPALRPQSMSEVAEEIQRLLNQKLEKQKVPKKEKKTIQFPEVQKLRTRLLRFSAVFVALIGIVIGGLTYVGVFKQDVEVAFQQHANRYSDSVAFVLVEYTLSQEDVVIYQRRTEGTAFLVDREGYLVTNRHVAAPWLLDRDFHRSVAQINRQKVRPQFDYQMYLWFEGEKAYQRIPSLLNSGELSDIYYLKSAYSSHGKPRVEIAGIERSVIYPSFALGSPLKDDFAILKIDQVPPNLEPIPLDSQFDLQYLKKLSPVITIGFPLGSRAQDNKVNVSVTKGNVRRTFEDTIQVDTSIYKGNSGGPIIDVNGKAIGIATGIMFDTAMGIVPIVTPLSDIGMVLPITKTVKFLEELKQGQPKWNGILDLSVDQKIAKIKNLAIEGKWLSAISIVDNELRYSLEPKLFTTGGIMHFCVGDYVEAKQLFSRAVSMDPNYNEANLMLYLIDWNNGNFEESSARERLQNIDWRSNAEFYRYLLEILEGKIDLQSALKGWYTESEKSWIYYIASLVHYRNRNPEAAEKLLKDAAIAADQEKWVLYLILAELQRIQDQHYLLSRGRQQKNKLDKEIRNFYRTLFDAQQERLTRTEKYSEHYSRLMQPNVKVPDKITILEHLAKADPNNKDLLVSLAVFYAMEDEWQTALKYINQYVTRGTRENKDYLSVRVLELGAMKKQGVDKVNIDLKSEEILNGVKNEWYRSLFQSMSDGSSENRLLDQASQVPERLLTAHFTLGLWAEGKGDISKAINHYKEALGTYLEGWWEYDFAKVRIRKLRLNEMSNSS